MTTARVVRALDSPLSSLRPQVAQVYPGGEALMAQGRVAPGAGPGDVDLAEVESIILNNLPADWVG
ncbi:hypothetical protein [Corallococcus sp. EGB]|uniref:hypothetical protein n=1 Tax=Corallococcus sp. EGB TaxID=1521117 RepID=UPI001CC0D6A6|nr:hypothetical protein [Corallococcus sp. EGB]